MDRQEVIGRIREAVPGAAEILVEGADCDFTAVVLCDSFAGLGQVKRQQRVLAQFAALLASGELHALSVKAYTPQEWRARQAQSLTPLSP